MLEEVCFKRQDGAADPLYHVSDGWVDLREVAHLLQGSTEGSIGLPMQMNTCNLVSLNTEHRKMRLSQLRSITGREGTPSDPFILKFFNSPNQRSGAAAQQIKDTSVQRAAAIAQPPLKQLPSLNRLEEFLFGPLGANNKLPLSLDLLNQLRNEDPSVAAGFVADNGAAGQLARLLSHSIEWQPSVGGEALTADAVNQILINTLQGIDRLVEAERSLGITVRRKWGGHGGQPRVGENLPDGQLLGGCGPALLSLWEERGCEHTLKEAANDLAAKAPAHVPDGVPYLVCFAAAGTQLQFYAVRNGVPSASPKPLGRVFDMGEKTERAWAVLAAANLYRLLACYGGSSNPSPNKQADQLAHAMTRL